MVQTHVPFLAGVLIEFCLKFMFLFLPCWLAPALDIATGGGPPITLHLLALNQSVVGKAIEARLQNTTAMPLLCRDIIPLDAVANISVAETCSEWCHEALGPNIAAPYMLSFFHVLAILGWDKSHIYFTCWKTQTAAWSLELMPEWYWVYLLAMVYGLWSIIAFLCTFCNTEPQTVPGGPAQDHITPDGPYGRRCGDIPCCCLPVRSNQTLPTENGWNEAPLCYPVSSDRNGSEIGLKIAAFLICFEPFGDIVSILTLLRIGQPFPAAFMALGIASACAVACDPLQLSGARAVAESLRNGFETRALLQHKDHELLESEVCATVQVYSLMSLHPKTATLSTGLNLVVSASLNLVISIPAQKQAKHVIRELKDSEWTFANIQKAKRYYPPTSYKSWVLVIAAMYFSRFFSIRSAIDWQAEQWFGHLGYLFASFCGLDRIGELWPILWDPETWQQWLLALLLMCFRLSCVCILVAGVCFDLLSMVHRCWVLLKGCFLPDERSNSQTDGLPLLDTEGPISSRLGCLKCEESQSSEESTEESSEG